MQFKQQNRLRIGRIIAYIRNIVLEHASSPSPSRLRPPLGGGGGLAPLSQADGQPASPSSRTMLKHGSGVLHLGGLSFLLVLSLVRTWRLQEISQHSRHIHIWGLSGTRLRAGPERPIWQQDLENHWAVHFGYGRGALATKATGVSLLLSKRWFRRKDLRATLSPPAALQG